MKNAPAVTTERALANLHEQDTPESKAIIDYISAIKSKNIAILGIDEAFVLTDGEGQIKAFKSALQFSESDGTLIQPVYNGPFVVSAQGYEVWAEKTGTSVIFPKEVLVGTEWKPNPYAERDPKNRRILAVHARAVAFRFSSMGIPQVSDWTTIFDTPSYRMIDLLAKAKKKPQAFKLLPSGAKPPADNHETWASYPFDESTSLWVNTSHDEVIGWYSTILNREKKAMDFAQTFAKRNALKHLSGIQKAPGKQWTLSVLAWRPTGNNVIKWDATQYSQLQDRVAGIIEGDHSGFDSDNTKQIEIKKGIDRTSEDENFATLESETDPEDQTEVVQEKTDVKPTPEKLLKEIRQEKLSKEIRQVISMEDAFPNEFATACKSLGLGNDPMKMTVKECITVYGAVNSILDSNASE